MAVSPVFIASTLWSLARFNSKKKERAPGGGKDENVFDIQQGVAIGLFVQCAVKDEVASVAHADLWGKRDTSTDGKYDWLAARDVESTGWAPLSPRSPLHLFELRDETLSDEYEAAWPIPKIFSPSGDPAPGIVTTHDQFAISWTRKEAASKVERLLTTTSEEEARSIWRLCSQNQLSFIIIDPAGMVPLVALRRTKKPGSARAGTCRDHAINGPRSWTTQSRGTPAIDAQRLNWLRRRRAIRSGGGAHPLAATRRLLRSVMVGA